MSSTKPFSPSSSEEFKLYVWDIGTTGKDPDYESIRTLAVVEYTSSTKFVTRFSSAVCPRDTSTVKIYDPTAPPFSLAWKQLVSFIRKLSSEKQPLLISHNAHFHLSFIQAELARDGMQLPSDWHFACSLELARSLKVESNGYSQSALAAHFGIDIDRGHCAEADILVLRDILMAIDAKYCDQSSTSSLTMLCHDPKVGPSSRSKDDARCDVKDTDRTSTDTKELRNSSPSFESKKGTSETKAVCFCVRQFLSAANEYQEPTSSKSIGESTFTSHRGNSSAALDSQKTSSPSAEGKYFITRTGSKFHVDGCQWLRRSRIQVDSPPSDLSPCGTCIPFGDAHRGGKASTESVRDVANLFYVTRTGKKYHVDGCKWLKTSKIPTAYPPAGFGPCSTCLPNKAHGESSSSSLRDTESCPSPRSVADVGAARFYLTKSGEKYHVEGCKTLKRSKIPTDVPPVSYGPCRICIGGNSGTGLNASKEVTCQEVVRQGGEPKAAFYLTRSGSKFHIDGCGSLSKSKIACDSPPTGFAPCGRCLPFGIDEKCPVSSCTETVESMTKKLSTFPKTRTRVKRE